MRTALEIYAGALENLSRDTLTDLPRYVAENVVFRDPFNHVIGVDKMQAMFAHMYDTLGDVRFEVLHQAMTGSTGLLHWRYIATLRGKPWSFEGMSKVIFNADGLVISHEDHWDAARHFYEHFPIIGWMLKAIRRKLFR
ncbi:MAG: nuclear transport factor 2 family protein [Parvibaculum sp.]